MVTKDNIWSRIRGKIKVIVFAIFMFTFFTLAIPLVTSVLNTAQEPQAEIETQRISPLPGHWLKTKDDRSTSADLQPKTPSELVKEQVGKHKNPGVLDKPESKPESNIHNLEEKRTHNNKKLTNTEVVFYWTEGQQLKALTIMSLNQESRRGGVVALPLYTKVAYEGKITTIAELFAVKGREAVTGLLEQQMDVTVESYVDIDQNTFEKLSEMMGPVDIKGEVITVAEAFEQTRIGQRKDDTAVVRAVASRIIRPDMLIKIPKMVWVLSKEIETNLGPGEIMTIYKITQNTDVETMTKVALPGENYIKNGKKYRDVEEQVWKNILWELTK